MTDASPPLGRVLMVQGTSSHAGKSTLVAAFCRLFAAAGYRVAPFKAQNMSNNAAVTADGGEIGRAQAFQAMAARVPFTVDMNPVLLKPQSDRTSQVVVLGRARYTTDARAYYALKDELWPVVTGALDRLRASHDLVVIEGAGSPAEINLAKHDIVNMRVARYADAPVLLVADIDRGGVFASLYGTVMLVEPEERALIRGFILNKFRGDPALLDPGFEMLREHTGVPTLGVLPYLDLSRLPAEDALEWETLRGDPQDNGDAVIDIAVLRLPRVANLDEFQPLATEPGVRVRFVGTVAELGTPDLVIIPGTKSTLADLAWLRDRGLDTAIRAHHAAGAPVLGICGGFQMLGTRIIDVDGAEAAGGGDAAGLGLLPITTRFAENKITRRVNAVVSGATALWGPKDSIDDGADDGSRRTLESVTLTGYEIHMGRSDVDSRDDGPVERSTRAPFAVSSGPLQSTDGLTAGDGLVVGTYMHGLLENAPLRRAMMQRLAARKGVTLPPAGRLPTLDQSLNMLAETVRAHVDCDAVAGMVGLPITQRS